MVADKACISAANCGARSDPLALLFLGATFGIFQKHQAMQLQRLGHLRSAVPSPLLLGRRRFASQALPHGAAVQELLDRTHWMLHDDPAVQVWQRRWRWQRRHTRASLIMSYCHSAGYKRAARGLCSHPR